MASQDLVWLIVRNNSSFLVKRNGVQFSAEAGNLLNRNSYKYSGLANNRVVDIKAAKEKGAVVSVRSARDKTRKPSTALKAVSLKRDFRRVARGLRNSVTTYRPDLKRAALARWYKIAQSKVAKKKTTREAKKGSKRAVKK